eukprot:s968_g13.t1
MQFCKASHNTVPILGLAQKLFRIQDFSSAHRHHFESQKDLSLSRFCGCTEWFTQAWPQRNLLEVHHADSNCSKTTALASDMLPLREQNGREKPYHKGTGPNSCLLQSLSLAPQAQRHAGFEPRFRAIQKRSYTEP